MRLINFCLLLLWLGLLLGSPFTSAQPLSPDQVELTLLDVGQGEAILVESGTEAVLIDTGPDPSIAHLLQRELRGKKLKYLVLTHPHADHISGANSVLDRYDIEQIIATGVEYDSKGYAGLLDRMKASGRLVLADQGKDFTLGEVRFDILYPFAEMPSFDGDVNDTSVVIGLHYRNFDALLTGDASAAVEHELLSGLQSYEILKVGHQGSHTSSSPEFLGKVRPKAALISAGMNNSYGHPHGEVLSRLQGLAADIYRTDLNGTIRVITDGQKFYIDTEKIPKSP